MNWCSAAASHKWIPYHVWYHVYHDMVCHTERSLMRCSNLLMRIASSGSEYATEGFCPGYDSNNRILDEALPVVPYKD